MSKNKIQSIRDAFGKALVIEGKKNKKILAVSVDLMGACKLNYFFENFPERFFEVGIAEANAIGIATGLSFEGFRPFVASFGSFISGKNTEIRNSISYNNAPVVIVGTHCGLIGSDGATQSALQDLSIMRSMPYFNVFQPCTPLETKEIIKYVSKTREPTYLRIPRNEIPEFLNKKYKFKIGMPNEIIKGKKKLIISSGAMVYNCLKAIKGVPESGYGLVNISSIKPLNSKALIKIIKKYKKIITVEDHSILGGLGSIVSEIIAENNLNIQFKKHGIKNGFINSDTPENLEKEYQMDVESLKKIFNKT
jgi:transketolase